jgi:hypothetical protein
VFAVAVVGLFFLIAFESCVTYPPGSGLRRYC